jgi:hypothetical protein
VNGTVDYAKAKICKNNEYELSYKREEVTEEMVRQNFIEHFLARINF